jgi:hypothetical protein
VSPADALIPALDCCRTNLIGVHGWTAKWNRPVAGTGEDAICIPFHREVRVPRRSTVRLASRFPRCLSTLVGFVSFVGFTGLVLEQHQYLAGLGGHSAARLRELSYWFALHDLIFGMQLLARRAPRQCAID